MKLSSQQIHDKAHLIYRVRRELTDDIYKLIDNFHSTIEPDYKKLSKDDIIYVLSLIISKETEKI
jgi:hypothetical protein